MTENSDKPAKSNIQVDLGAKAEMKLGLEARIPEKSAGRLVDALTDLLRPISESRGLKADQIRLQREDVAIKIALKARDRLRIENEEIKAVPPKILVPLLEASSNESADDDAMHERWANLLASAATRANVEPRYIGILREIHGRQATILERIGRNRADDFKRPIAQLQDSPALLDPALVRQQMRRMQKTQPILLDAGAIYAEILEWIDRPGCAVVDVLVHIDENSWSLDATDRFTDFEHELDLEILCSLGLLRRHSEIFSFPRNTEVQIVYYHMTELGVQFFLACNNLAPEESTPNESEHSA